MKFEELNLSKEILRSIKEKGFEETTRIQEEAIPLVTKGLDVIGQSQTGTGKTAAFGIPIIEKLDTKQRAVQAIILAPTRELSIQIAEEMSELAKYVHGIRIVPIYGGQAIERQISRLKSGANIVIGTPGRIMDHLRRKTLKLSAITTVVLDEADEMLNMGFEEDIVEILKDAPIERQTVLFSATMPKRILDITKKYQKNPKHVQIVPKQLAVPNIEQKYFELKDKMKTEILTRVLDIYDPELTVVFCNTKRRVDEVVEALRARGYAADAIHGDMKQMQRDRVMKKARNNELDVLVATDVAARGIDVEFVEMVINYDLPQEEEYYVHRIGRTGRIGRKGRAYTFIVGKEAYRLKDIERYIKSKILLEKLPTMNEVETIRNKDFMDKISDIIENNKYLPKASIVDEMLEQFDYTALDIAKALYTIYNVKEVEAQAPEISMKTNRDGMVRLFLSVGRKDNIMPKDIVGSFASNTSLSGGDIGKIDIYDSYSFVNVPKDYVAEILKQMNGNTIKNKKVSLEIANAK